MTYVKYKPEHSKVIVSLGAVGICTDISEEDVEVFSECKSSETAFTCMDEDQPISCGGYDIMWPGVGQAWYLCVKNIKPMAVRGDKMKFMELIKDSGLWRVQAPLIAGSKTTVRFAEYMGFEYEATLKKYHMNKKDALMYILGDL